MSAEILLHPCHPDYCNKCVYMGNNGECTNKDYIKNSYKVVCVWNRCPYRRTKLVIWLSKKGRRNDYN